MQPDAVRCAVAEFVGTFALVVAVIGTIAVGGEIGLLGVALGQGLMLAVMVVAVARISGAHFNPAVTLAMLLTRRMEPVLAGTYWIAQLAGAAAAALVMDLLYPDRFNGALKASAPSISPESGFGTGGALIFEGLLAFFLVWVVFAVAVDERRPAVGGIAIGLTVSVGVLVGGAITGAAMNPARAFGPQLVFGEWADAWIYYVGPLVGGALAALLFSFLYAPTPTPRSEIGGQAEARPPDHGSGQASA